MTEPLFEVWLMDGPQPWAFPLRCSTALADLDSTGPWSPIDAMRVINKFQEKNPEGTYELVQVR